MTAIWDFVTGLFGTLTDLLTLLTPIFILVSGIVSLFFGRKLFWVFVAAIGFLLGLYLFEYVGPLLPEFVAPYKELVRLALALATAGVALIIQRAGTILAGAFAVGILGWWLAGRLEIADWGQWAAAIFGGLLGAILLYLALDWMLLVLTALVGGLIALTGMQQLEGLPVGTGPWLYVVLVVAGLFYQQRELRQDSRLAAAAPAPAPAPKPARAPSLPRLRRKSAKLAEESAAGVAAIAAPAAVVAAPALSSAAPAPVPSSPAHVAPALAAPVIIAPAAAAPAARTSPANGLPAASPVTFGADLFAPSKGAPAAAVAAASESASSDKAKSGGLRLPTFTLPKFTLHHRIRRTRKSAGAPLPESELVPLEPLSSTEGYPAYAPPQTYAPPAPRGSVPPPVAHTVYG